MLVHNLVRSPWQRAQLLPVPSSWPGPPSPGPRVLPVLVLPAVAALLPAHHDESNVRGNPTCTILLDNSDRSPTTGQQHNTRIRATTWQTGPGYRADINRLQRVSNPRSNARLSSPEHALLYRSLLAGCWALSNPAWTAKTRSAAQKQEAVLTEPAKTIKMTVGSLTRITQRTYNDAPRFG
jgi:hypothetical protein